MEKTYTGDDTVKKITRCSIILYCLPLFAVGLFTSMLNDYRIYFYQPTDASGLPILITQKLHQ